MVAGMCDRVFYTGYVIGGPAHGSHQTVTRPFWETAEEFWLPVRAEVSLVPRSPMAASTRYVYRWHEFYSEWGREARGFVWLPMIDTKGFDEFIGNSVDGNGIPRQVNCINRDIIWPGNKKAWRK